MALTRSERVALKAARARIKTNESSFICLALASAARDGRCSWRSVHRLRAYIQASFGRHSSLGHWQAANGFGHRTDEQRRQDRIDWIDWMLDQ